MTNTSQETSLCFDFTDFKILILFLRITVVSHLNGFQLRCLWHLLHIRWQDRVTNTEVLERAGSLNMPSLPIQRRIRWLDHVHRMEPDRLPREILYGELREGVRRVGRPLLGYNDVINGHQCMGGYRQTPRYVAAKCQSGGFKGGSEH